MSVLEVRKVRQLVVAATLPLWFYRDNSPEAGAPVERFLGLSVVLQLRPVLFVRVELSGEPVGLWPLFSLHRWDCDETPRV